MPCAASRFPERRRPLPPHDEIVVECELSVKPGNGEFIRAKMVDTLAAASGRSRPTCRRAGARRATRKGIPRRCPSGRPARGVQCAAAQVSEQHANFIVNTGGAKAVDVLTLMREAQVGVERQHGIELQPEVRFLGFE